MQRCYVCAIRSLAAPFLEFDSALIRKEGTGLSLAIGGEFAYVEYRQGSERTDPESHLGQCIYVDASMSIYEAFTPE